VWGAKGGGGMRVAEIRFSDACPRCCGWPMWLSLWRLGVLFFFRVRSFSVSVLFGLFIIFFCFFFSLSVEFWRRPAWLRGPLGWRLTLAGWLMQRSGTVVGDRGWGGFADARLSSGFPHAHTRAFQGCWVFILSSELLRRAKQETREAKRGCHYDDTSCTEIPGILLQS